MTSEDNERQLPAGCDQSYTPPNLPHPAADNTSELVPIFLEDEYLRTRDRGDLSQFTAAYDPASATDLLRRPSPFQFPLPQIARLTMADRFPSIEDLNTGETS